MVVCQHISKMDLSDKIDLIEGYRTTWTSTFSITSQVQPLDRRQSERIAPEPPTQQETGFPGALWASDGAILFSNTVHNATGFRRRFRTSKRFLTVYEGVTWS